MDEVGVVAGQEKCQFGDVDRLAPSLGRGAQDLEARSQAGKLASPSGAVSPVMVAPGQIALTRIPSLP